MLDTPLSNSQDGEPSNLPRRDTPSKTGFNVIGYVSHNLGMGVAARHIIRALLDQGHGVAVLDIEIDGAQEWRDHSYADITVGSALELPYAINLVMLDITRLPDLFMTPPEGLFREDRVNVGLIWWELTVLADRWIEALRLFDAMLAGSEFIRHVLEFNVPAARVVQAKVPVYLQKGTVAPDRSRFGLPAAPVLFLSSFDPQSCVQRKNPFGAIAAFQEAFPDKDDRRASLVIKLNNAKSRAKSVQNLLNDLREQCANDSRLLLVTESLSDVDLLQLYASCDVFVSLHRSEGLGLGPLEAMRLGRPVIATAWSGNMTYMNHWNACLVSYRFVPAGGHDHYVEGCLGKSAFWADPDLGEAAGWMRALVENPELREQFARRGLESAIAYQRDAERTAFVNELLAIQQANVLIPERGGRRYLDVGALREADRAHRKAVRETADAKRLGMMTSRERLLTKARTSLERHVLWRFK